MFFLSHGSIGATNKSTGATLPSSVDLWGETWTTTAINDVDFGVVIDTIRAGILSGKTIEAISAGRYNACVIASNNQVYCWGSNFAGNLGNNSSVNSSIPVEIFSGPY